MMVTLRGPFTPQDRRDLMRAFLQIKGDGRMLLWESRSPREVAVIGVRTEHEAAVLQAALDAVRARRAEGEFSFETGPDPALP